MPNPAPTVVSMETEEKNKRKRMRGEKIFCIWNIFFSSYTLPLAVARFKLLACQTYDFYLAQ